MVKFTIGTNISKAYLTSKHISVHNMCHGSFHTILQTCAIYYPLVCDYNIISFLLMKIRLHRKDIKKRYSINRKGLSSYICFHYELLNSRTEKPGGCPPITLSLSTFYLNMKYSIFAMNKEIDSAIIM